ncbi:MAG: uracil-DNA glycosylase family protein, partial [Deltaproteobacteria bacterium]
MNDLSLLKEIPDPLTDAPSAPAAVAATRSAEASPVRSQIRRRRRAALTIGAVWLGAHLAAYGVRQDMHRLPAPYVAAQMVLPALLAVGSLLLAVAPGKLGVGLGVSLLAVLAVLGPLSFWLVAAGMPRERVAVSNVVKCRPPGNRPPTRAEVVTCRGWLAAQILLI